MFPSPSLCVLSVSSLLFLGFPGFSFSVSREAHSAESAVSHLTREPGSLSAGGIDHQLAQLFFIGNSLCLSLLSVAGTKNTDKHILHVQVTVHHVGKSGRN